MSLILTFQYSIGFKIINTIQCFGSKYRNVHHSISKKQLKGKLPQVVTIGGLSITQEFFPPFKCDKAYRFERRKSVLLTQPPNFNSLQRAGAVTVNKIFQEVASLWKSVFTC